MGMAPIGDKHPWVCRYLGHPAACLGEVGDDELKSVMVMVQDTVHRLTGSWRREWLMYIIMILIWLNPSCTLTNTILLGFTVFLNIHLLSLHGFLHWIVAAKRRIKRAAGPLFYEARHP